MATNDQRVRERAYELWQENGGGHGSAMDYWLRAERELADAGKTDAGKTAGGGARTKASASKAAPAAAGAAAETGKPGRVPKASTAKPTASKASPRKNPA